MIQVPAGVWFGIQFLGVVAIVVGARRALTAPKAAAERAAGHENPEVYQRGLTDFYRISGALMAVVGVILAIVPIFAR
jgi:hypothetical protein